MPLISLIGEYKYYTISVDICIILRSYNLSGKFNYISVVVVNSKKTGLNGSIIINIIIVIRFISLFRFILSFS